MATRKRKAKWCVEANTNEGRHGTREGWKPIYCSSSKAKAKKDARAWSRDVGQSTRVVPA